MRSAAAVGASSRPGSPPHGSPAASRSTRLVSAAPLHLIGASRHCSFTPSLNAQGCWVDLVGGSFLRKSVCILLCWVQRYVTTGVKGAFLCLRDACPYAAAEAGAAAAVGNVSGQQHRPPHQPRSKSCQSWPALRLPARPQPLLSRLRGGALSSLASTTVCSLSCVLADMVVSSASYSDHGCIRAHLKERRNHSALQRVLPTRM